MEYSHAPDRIFSGRASPALISTGGMACEESKPVGARLALLESTENTPAEAKPINGRFESEKELALSELETNVSVEYTCVNAVEPQDIPAQTFLETLPTVGLVTTI